MLNFRFLGVALIAVIVSACSGVGSVPPPSTLAPTDVMLAPAPNSQTAASGSVTESDAKQVAQGRRPCRSHLAVKPISLTFASQMPQTLQVTVDHATILFGASDDPDAATISPHYVNVTAKSGGTATFTVTPRNNNARGSIGLIDLKCACALVPFSIHYKSPSPAPSWSPSPFPSWSPSPAPSPSPSPIPSPPPTPSPSPTPIGNVAAAAVVVTGATNVSAAAAEAVITGGSSAQTGIRSTDAAGAAKALDD